MKKTYLALVHGTMVPEQGEIRAAVGRRPWNRERFGIVPEGKESVTRYTVTQHLKLKSPTGIIPVSYLKLVPLTGRTHQIRVHLAHIGHPVFGDPTYGGRSETWGGLTGKKSRQAASFLKIINRQALHAKTLGFVHPSTNKMIKFDSVQ